MRRRIWTTCLLIVSGSLFTGGAAFAQYPVSAPVRANAGFTMAPAGPAMRAAVLPPAPPISAGVHPHWGPTWTNTGAAAIPAVEGAAQPKYGWDAYPYPGRDGRYHGLRQGCANPITCGNFWSDKTFIFGSCRQYFGHGRGCGGWLHGQAGQSGPAATEGIPDAATSGEGCSNCSKGYWVR